MTGRKPLASESDLGAAFATAVPFVLPVRVFRRQIINAETKAGYHVRAGIKGQADYYAITRGGLHVEIETKAANPSRDKRTADAQTAWWAWCEEWRIPLLVLRARVAEVPGDTVIRWVGELRAVLEAWAVVRRIDAGPYG